MTLIEALLIVDTGIIAAAVTAWAILQYLDRRRVLRSIVIRFDDARYRPTGLDRRRGGR